jgi:HEAT repeat protein
LHAIRNLTDHSAWQVRTQAAITLGRVGDSSDTERLAQLLMDTHWWVRYRAAQSLLSLPFTDQDRLAAMVAQLPDRYAREMAQQVFAESDNLPC